MLNSSLLAAATDVINSNDPVQFRITARFINSEPGSTFNFTPFKINQLIIDRNYAENFADEIDLEFMISPKDYALIQDQGQNLLCILTVAYMSKTGKVVTTPLPIQIQYNVMIVNPRDIRNAVPDVQMYTTPSETITVRLVEKTVYELRQTKLNVIYQKMNVTQAIHAIASSFNIKKVHLTPPDNTFVYDHIVISSYQNMGSVYPYLQSNLGVYQKGINAYLTNDILYVYPAFETDPKYDKTAMFYQVDTGRFAGSHIFHKRSTDSVSIVVPSQPHTTDLSVAGSENVGTGFVFVKASRLTDGLTTIDSALGAQFTHDPSLSVALSSVRTVIKSVNNLFHVQGTDNPFPHMAKIAAHQASIMKMRWDNADPFLIDPPQRVIYYYDRNGTMIRKTGMFEKVKYMISYIKKIHQDDIFGCIADVTLRLSPNESELI